jgi:ribosomal protein S18 acetylase RimI-like enzyme
LGQIKQLWNEGFAGYFTDMSRSSEQVMNALGGSSLQPELSVVMRDGETPIGFVWICLKTVRGVRYAWNGGTGLRPGYRGQGLGKLLMQETLRVLEAAEVHTVSLAVRTDNDRAVGAYRSAGFTVTDRLAAMRREGRLVVGRGEGMRAGTEAEEVYRSGWRISCERPVDAANLPFYRTKVAWSNHWFNLAEGEALIVRDEADQPLGYALLRRRCDDYGRLRSISLHQLEEAPGGSGTEAVYRMLLAEAFTSIDDACLWTTDNLSMESPGKIRLLQQSGFSQVREQYLMTLQLRRAGKAPPNHRKEG